MTRWLSSLLVVFLLPLVAADLTGQTRRQAQFDATKRMFATALAQDPDDLNALYNLSRLFLDIVQVDSAKTLLERALKIEPENALFLVERGRVHLEDPDKIELKDARKYLEMAYELEPDLLTAQYYLAIAYIYPIRGRRLIPEAQAMLNAVLDINPQYKDATFYAAVAEQYGKNSALATGQYEATIMAHPRHGAAGVRLAEIMFYGKGNLEQACGLYLAALENLHNPLELNRVSRETDFVFTREEFQQLYRMYPRRRGPHLARYWRAQDPTPGTLLNERLTEHFRRMNLARSMYGTEQGALGFDDRGVVYVKYGEPDDKYLGYHEMEYAASESWVYFSIDPNLAFDFIERGGYFTKDLDLREIMIFSNFGLDDNYWEQLQRIYRDRVDLGGIYARLGLKGMGYRGSDHEFEQLLEGSVALRSKAITDVPPVKFKFDYKLHPLDFLYEKGMFRASDGLTRFEVYYGLPLENLRFRNVSGDMVVEPIKMDVTFQDMEYRPVQRFLSELSVSYLAGANKKKAFHVNQSAYDLPPGNYVFSISFKAPESNLWGIYSDSIRVPDYGQPERLMLSSIQMSPEYTAPSTFVENAYKGGFVAIPHPSMSFTQDQPAFMFYEIYNLAYGPTGRTDYEVEITYEAIQPGGVIRSTLGRLFSRSSNQPTITLTESGSSDTRTDHRMTSIDLGRVREGDMLVTVKVTDNNSGQTASQSQIFIVERAQ